MPRGRQPVRTVAQRWVLIVGGLLVFSAPAQAQIAPSRTPSATNQVQDGAAVPTTAPGPPPAAASGAQAGSAISASPATPSTGVAATGAPQPAVQPPLVTAPGVAVAGAGAITNLEAAQQSLAQLQAQARTTTDEAKLLALRNQSATAQAAAEGLIKVRSNDLKGVDQELGHYETSAKHRAESEAERRRHALLLARRAELERQLQQAQKVSTVAGHTYDLVAERRRDSFTAKVLAQTDSPVSPAFWSSLADSSGPDFNRLLWVSQRAIVAAAQAPEPKGLLSFIIACAVAAALLFPARAALEKLVSVKRAPQLHHGFRLSFHAIWIMVVDTLLPALAANTVRLGAQWGGLLSERADALAAAGVVAISWGAAVVALGRATVATGDSETRLLDLPDDAVGRVRFYLWLVALITGAGFLLTRLNDVVGASIPATVAANCLMSLAYAGVAGLVLVSFGRNRRPVEETESAEAAVRSSGWTLFSLALTLAIIVTVGAVVAGYTTLAVLISGQIFWLSMLGAVTYLLLRFINDLTAVLFHPKGWAAQTLVVLFNLRGATISQIGVLIAAGLQIVVLAGVLGLALTPFGQSGASLLGHFGGIGRSFHIGSAVISPAAVLTGLATLVAGMAAVHVVRRWVAQRYLPATDWDAGVRNSVTTGVGYLGVGLTLICALAAMGLGFKQIALVASALSVGIGFGLQQVVQNFVSGIILLIERPVKVGDWVNLSGVEGDVRSIRVRATEVQTFDRTTVIVPNSDLITKIVQNKTLGDPRGRIQLQLSIANPGDARRAAELILQAAKARALILTDPAPAVYIDSLAEGGGVNFNCYLFVQSPRDVYKTRSALYYDILAAFIDNKIAFAGTASVQDVVVEPGPQLQQYLNVASRPAAPG